MQYHLKSSTCHALAACDEVKLLILLILKINDLRKKRINVCNALKKTEILEKRKKYPVVPAPVLLTVNAPGDSSFDWTSPASNITPL